MGKLRNIPIKKLHAKFVPNETPLDIWNYDMSLKNSPHLELIFLISQYGFDWEKIFKSRFVKIQQHKYIMGFDGYGKDDIERIVKNQWEIYKSISLYGYRKKKWIKHPVMVSKKPIHKQKNILQGMEIQDGTARCAAIMMLGIQTIAGYYVNYDYCNR